MAKFASFPRVENSSSFSVPEKKINTDADVARFQISVAFDRIVGFIILLNESVKGKSCAAQDTKSNKAIKAVENILDVLNTYIDEIPPSTGPRRFGNIAFRQWIQRLEGVYFCVEYEVDFRPPQSF